MLPAKSPHQKTCFQNGTASRLVLGGDMIITKSLLEQIRQHEFESEGFVNKNIHQDNFQSESIFQHEISSFIRSADLFVFNFEGVITSRTVPRPKILPSFFNFGSPPEFVQFLKNFKSGALVLSVANNHSLDFGEDALSEMMAILTQAGIGYVGGGRNVDEATRPLIRQVGPLRLAILAYTDLLPWQYYATPNQRGVAKLTLANLSRGIDFARSSSADLIIISLHTVVDARAPFSFIPDARQVYFSKLAIDCGADIVFGHQPAGLQHYARYRNGLIFYSLGAFLYDPAIGKYFPRGHESYDATQVFGGALTDIRVCHHGFYTFDIRPITVIPAAKNKLYVTPDDRVRRLPLAFANWASRVILEKLPPKVAERPFVRKLLTAY